VINHELDFEKNPKVNFIFRPKTKVIASLDNSLSEEHSESLMELKRQLNTKAREMLKKKQNEQKVRPKEYLKSIIECLSKARKFFGEYNAVINNYNTQDLSSTCNTDSYKRYNENKYSNQINKLKVENALLQAQMGKLETAFDTVGDISSRVLLERDFNLSETKPLSFSSSDCVKLEKKVKEWEKKYKDLQQRHKKCLLELERTRQLLLERSKVITQYNKIFEENIQDLRNAETNLNTLKSNLIHNIEKNIKKLNPRMERIQIDVKTYKALLLSSIGTSNAAHSIFLQVSLTKP